MEIQNDTLDRRYFIKKSSSIALGVGSLLTCPQTVSAASIKSQNDISILGPKEGFSPQIGTLVSMMNWMRFVILMPIKGMRTEDLD